MAYGGLRFWRTMRLKDWIPTLAAIAVIMLVVPFTVAKPFNDDGSPNAANKTAAAGGHVIELIPDYADNDVQGTTILDTYVKSGGPKDLLLSVTLECALWTQTTVTTILDDRSQGDLARAAARVDVWVEIDGQPVSIAGADDGKITFCDRVQEQGLSDMDDGTGNWTMRTYLATKSANAFNWVAFDVGSGTHHIVVKADITSENTEGELAAGAIGSRTLLVETTDFPRAAGL